jgi:dihydrofolate synthase/folylpolyglutamate synthase
MARSDAILDRLLMLHPKVIDLSLERIERLLGQLGNPHEHLPPVIHVAGTNGKGSVIAYMRTALESAGARVHCYTSPHLVRFHERIRLAGTTGSAFIDEAELVDVLGECERANGGEPITFFEITTAAAFLSFTRHAADVVLLETGLGGRLDATNLVDQPALTVITSLDLDHQQFLGDTLEEIAGEKAGILKRGVTCAVARQADGALGVIERRAARLRAPLLVGGEDWQVYEQHGRLVYQDEAGLLDLPLPRLAGRFQIENAGLAIAALRAQTVAHVGEDHIAAALRETEWPARLSRLTSGVLIELLPNGSELWLDGGHNPAAGAALSSSMADLEDRVPRPLILIVGMLNTKDASGFLKPFQGLAHKVISVTVPGEENAASAEVLAAAAASLDLDAQSAPTVEAALSACAADENEPPRVLVCGSLYFAGHVLALQSSETA